jgi:nucleoside-diphosphate-sugar epimerase
VANVQERPFAVLRDNVEMLLSAIELGARQGNLQRFVFASTSEVYAGTLEHYPLPIPTPETTPLALPDLARPRTSYMLSKIYGEALCRHAGIPHTIVRPHNVYGPRMGMAHVVPELLKRAIEAPRDGELAVYSVDQTRTFCYIDDAIEILLRAAETPGAEGRALNLGAQSPEVSIGSLAEKILAATGRTDLRIVPRPAPPGSPARRCPDMTETERLIGFRAQVTLDEGIARTLQWYRAQGFLPETAPARRP